MLAILVAIGAGIMAIRSMLEGNVAATVFFCFCLHWLRDCFVVSEEDDEDG